LWRRGAEAVAAVPGRRLFPAEPGASGSVHPSSASSGVFIMRKITLTLGLAIACISGVGGPSGAWAAEPGAAVIYLDGPASLAQLRAANPIHYQRALKIIDAANELCRPQPGELEYTKFDAKNISCAQSLLLTSNPPKRQLSFRLDDTQYIALVAVTDDPPKLVAASPHK
jgi:hypothetical protein